MTDFPTLPTFSYSSTSEIPTLLFTWSLKKIPLSGGASLYRPSYGVPTHSQIPPMQNFTLLLYYFVLNFLTLFHLPVCSCILDQEKQQDLKWMLSMWLQNSPDFSFGTAFMKVKHIKIYALTVYNNVFLLVCKNVILWHYNRQF